MATETLSVFETLLNAVEEQVEAAKLFDKVSIGLVERWDTYRSLCMIMPTGDVEQVASNASVEVEYEVTIAFGIAGSESTRVTHRLLEARQGLKELFRCKDIVDDPRVLMLDVVGGGIAQYPIKQGFRTVSELILRFTVREAL